MQEPADGGKLCENSGLCSHQQEHFLRRQRIANDVQTHKLGTIVGEVTGGGAHPTGPADLGHGFMASISLGRMENPITKTNWEGRGVQPDVQFASSAALQVALQRRPVSETQTASIKQVSAPRSAGRFWFGVGALIACTLALPWLLNAVTRWVRNKR